MILYKRYNPACLKLIAQYKTCINSLGGDFDVKSFVRQHEVISLKFKIRSNILRLNRSNVLLLCIDSLKLVFLQQLSTFLKNLQLAPHRPNMLLKQFK